MSERDVAFVIFDGVQTLDLAGPHEVFGAAGHTCRVVAATAGPVRSGSGLPIHAAYGVADLAPDGIDTLVVAGGGGVDRARRDRHARAVRRYIQYEPAPPYLADEPVAH